MWHDAFSSNNVLKNNTPLAEIGDECGTSAISPKRVRALFVLDLLTQHLFTLIGSHLNNHAVLDAHEDARDERPPCIRKWLCARDETVDTIPVRSSEDFLGRDVVVTGDAVLRLAVAAGPDMIVRQSNREGRYRGPTKRKAE